VPNSTTHRGSLVRVEFEGNFAVRLANLRVVCALFRAVYIVDNYWGGAMQYQHIEAAELGWNLRATLRYVLRTCVWCARYLEQCTLLTIIGGVPCSNDTFRQPCQGGI